MLKIEVDKNDKLENIKGKSKGTPEKPAKEYDIWKQKAYVHLPSSRYPVLIEVNIDDERAAYPAGFYTIDPASFYVGNFNALSIRFMKLIPLTEAQIKQVG